MHFPVLCKSTCFSGCLKWVTMRNISCRLHLGDAKWAGGLGSSALNRPFVQGAQHRQLWLRGIHLPACPTFS